MRRAAETRSEPGAVPWAALAAATVVASTLLLTVDHGRSWHYFVDAGSLLFASDGAGLELYEVRPDLQFGPVMAVTGRLLGGLPDAVELWTVMTLGSLAGVLTLLLIADTVVRLRPAAPRSAVRRAVLAAFVPFQIVWVRLAAYTTHVDDVLAVTALAGAVAAIARGRRGWAVAALALAVAVKPWAAIFLPLTLVGPGRRAARLGLAALVPLLTWSPFLIAAPGSLGALSDFALPIDPNSGLRVLGVGSDMAPDWVRPVQLGLGLVVTAAIALRRAEWWRLLAAGSAVRLLLDPATNHYYAAGFVAGALVWELARHPGQLPWRTGVVLVVLEVAAEDVTLSGTVRIVRALVLLAVIGAALVADRSDDDGRGERPGPQMRWISRAS